MLSHHLFRQRATTTTVAAKIALACLSVGAVYPLEVDYWHTVLIMFRTPRLIRCRICAPALQGPSRHSYRNVSVASNSISSSVLAAPSTTMRDRIHGFRPPQQHFLVQTANPFWGIVAVFGFIVGMSNASVETSSCHKAGDTSSTLPATPDAALQSTEPSDADGQDEGPDPYDNLPEEDEETTCSMCLTFRKGPCRPLWRKLERCFKDHEKEENGAVQCMRYFNPHHQCLAQYTNLYQLVSLEAKQELVHDIQKSVTKEECRSWEPTIDWTMWKRFCTEDNGLSLPPQIVRTSKDTPYWQRLPENTEPLLITLTSSMPQKDSDGLLLKIAFAVDQDGIVIGLTFNSEYGKLMDQAKGKTKDDVGGDGDASVAGESADEGETRSHSLPTDMDLEFFVLPGATERIRVYGLYSENPVLASADKDILDATLYKSPLYPLSDVA